MSGHQREVDLPQLFSDVSRTISGISNIMGAGLGQDGDSTSGASSSSSSSGPSMMSGLFGNTCFKACGMEDIQYAARSAGDMFLSFRVCIIIFTIVALLCLLTLTATVVYLVCKKQSPSRRFPLPAFVRDVFPSKDGAAKDENQNS
ncbi:unnamed protein product [Auanema sp. JU1783]|nr:unnamed protein product [Auanema sp. JU1783]